MRIATILTTFALLAVQTTSHDISNKRKIANAALNPHPHNPQFPISNSTDDVTGISPKVKAYWMHQTFHALNASGSPCPLYPFAAVIVNHTSTSTSPNNNAHNTALDLDRGELICTGVNQGRQTGNMILHGEIAAILNCTSILQDPAGKYRLSPAETIEAFKDLSLYTNAESCPMCASAVRWNGFKEYIYGTSIARLVEYGFAQITISSEEIFAQAEGLPADTALIGGVLAEETDRLFAWQFQDGECPVGCSRADDGEGRCQPV
ncbi:cytidine deaminase-like protein [Aspergillus insuetus]